MAGKFSNYIEKLIMHMVFKSEFIPERVQTGGRTGVRKFCFFPLQKNDQLFFDPKLLF